MSKTCQNCGNLFEDNTNVCPRCGMQYIESQPVAPMGGNNYSNQYQQPAYTQNPYQQNNYQQPYPQNYNFAAPSDQSMTLGSWVGTILLTHLFGIISIILLFVWGFSDSTPPAKKNYCRAMLIFEGIAIGIVIIMFIFLAAVGLSFADMY